MFKAKNKSFGLLTASEDQGEALYRENYRATIDRNHRLARRARVMRMRLEVPKANCLLEVLTTSHRSLTGRSRTHLLIDEARDIEAQVAAKLLPSVAAMHGIECPSGHVQLSPDDVEVLRGKRKGVPTKCSACGARLVQWWPRIIITSSSGVIQNNETDWFMELTESLSAEPDKNYHLFQSEEPLNPRKSPEVSDALERRFGQLDTMRPYVLAEFGNQFVTKGDAVVSIADVKRCMDRGLSNVDDVLGDPCVGFLDTSTTVDKTSLVILAEDREVSTFPWEHVYLAHLVFWVPSKLPRRVMDGEIVLSELESTLPLLRGLVSLFVDVKVGAKKDLKAQWPNQMMHEIRLKTGAPWAGKVKPWRGGTDESQVGWDLLIERFLSGTIRLQHSPAILAEMKGVVRKTPRQGDRKGMVVDRDRNKMHKDITEGLATCCYNIHIAQRRKRGSSMADIASRKKQQSRTVSERGLSFMTSGGKFSPDSF